ncbi:MAG: hypothetical protein ACQEQG_09600 [Bacillota bacterium]
MPDFNGTDKINIRNYKKLFKEKQKLEKNLKNKDDLIGKLRNEKESVENEYQEKTETLKKQLQNKNEEIKTLSDRLEEVSQAEDVDKSLVKQVAKNNIKMQVLEKEIDIKAERIIEVENKLDLVTRENIRLQNQLENIRDAFQQEQLAKEDLKVKLDNLQENLQAAFKPDDISKYFKQAIDDFNDQGNQGDGPVNYIINGMDVELKASLGRDGERGLLMSSPGFGSKREEALSQIKFTIRAVPRDMAGND